MAKDRQLGKTLGEIRRDHTERYRFAADYVTGTVLDAACGCGYGSRMLFGSATKVVGIDIDLGATKWAREHFPGPIYILGPIESAPWVGPFDWVVSFETIEHLKEPEQVLRSFRRDGANLIVSVPNENVTPFVREKFSGDDYPHQRHYTPEQFDELLKKTGWEVVERWSQAGRKGGFKQDTIGMFLIYVCK